MDNLRHTLPVARPVIPEDLRFSDDGQGLVYAQGRIGVRREYPPSLVNEFAALATGTNDRILRFAQQYGVLDLCSGHGFPHRHTEHLSPMDRFKAGCVGATAEPLSGWRLWAGEADAILRLVAPLRQRQTGDAALWNRLFRREIGQVEVSRMALDWMTLGRAQGWASVEAAQASLAGIVSQWFEWAGVRPILQWGALARDPGDALLEYRHEDRYQDDAGLPRVFFRSVDEPQLHFAGGLFGALALQLASAVTSATPPVPCTACGRYFSVQPARAARRGVNRFCPKCKGTAGERRITKQTQRAKAKTIALHKGRVPVTQIAYEVKRGLEVVRQWIREDKLRQRKEDSQ